jgi:predicted nucleotidyltransferase
MIVPKLGMIKKRKSSPPRSLADALFTKTQQRVLRLLFGQPERSFYGNELIRAAGSGSGAAQRELAKLETSGLAVVERVGRQKHYRANQASPLFAELSSIVAKTVGIAGPIRDALKPLQPRLRSVFVYGSVAKGRDRASSDIDLMVIGDDLSYGDVFAALEPATIRIGRPVNPTIYSSKEFSARKRTAFLTKVMSQPRIWILGSDDVIDA